jgi:SAM-dependent methyltransferase
LSEFKYVGSELDLFAAAHNWKAYWTEQLRPFIQGDVLEVGAGIGSNVRFFSGVDAGRWICLEPDPELVEKLKSSLAAIERSPQPEAICATLSAFEERPQFDSILYIDVLEHILDDRGELEQAALRLRPGGHLVVLSPAHQSLYSPFDAAIGHHRRYDRSMLLGISPPGLELERMRYLDSVGMALSAANTLMLKQSMPTASQLGVWNRWVIPPSRVLDKCIGYTAGKTIIAIWRKPVTNTTHN